MTSKRLIRTVASYLAAWLVICPIWQAKAATGQCDSLFNDFYKKEDQSTPNEERLGQEMRDYLAASIPVRYREVALRELPKLEAELKQELEKSCPSAVSCGETQLAKVAAKPLVKRVSAIVKNASARAFAFFGAALAANVYLIEQIPEGTTKTLIAMVSAVFLGTLSQAAFGPLLYKVQQLARGGRLATPSDAQTGFHRFERTWQIAEAVMTGVQKDGRYYEQESVMMTRQGLSFAVNETDFGDSVKFVAITMKRFRQSHPEVSPVDPDVALEFYLILKKRFANDEAYQAILQTLKDSAIDRDGHLPEVQEIYRQMLDAWLMRAPAQTASRAPVPLVKLSENSD